MLARSGCILLFVSSCSMSGEGRVVGGECKCEMGLEVLAVEASYLTTWSCEFGVELFYLK